MPGRPLLSAAPTLPTVAPTLLTVALALLTAAPAYANDPPATSPPSADAFDIRYFLTDGDGNRLRQMTKNDMAWHVNQARCECGQRIDTQVRLLNSGSFAQVLIEGFVGTQCATAEASFNPQFKSCVKFSSAQTNNYITGQNVIFSPIWLISGIANLDDPNNDAARQPDSAIPAGSCRGPAGQGGIWLCAHTDSVAGCQAEEFFITGTQNMNFPAGETPSGITADFQPPLSLPSNLRAAVGDSAAVLSWNLPLGGTDAKGFRVLCEDADTGLPAVEGVVSNPGVASQVYGQIYYTKENLCPDGPFWEAAGGSSVPADNDTTAGDTGDSDTTAGDSDTTAGDTDTTSGDTDTTSGDTDTTAGDTDTTAGDTDTTAGDSGTTAGDSGDDLPVNTVCPEDRPATGLCSLKWEYICSGHIANNTNSSRISGLENGKRYNFLLVAYDEAGNPAPAGEIRGIIPVETNDLWGQCEADGDVCGRAGFCSVDPRSGLGGRGLLGLLGLLGMGLLGASRRRTRKAT